MPYSDTSSGFSDDHVAKSIRSQLANMSSEAGYQFISLGLQTAMLRRLSDDDRTPIESVLLAEAENLRTVLVVQSAMKEFVRLDKDNPYDII